MVDSVSLSPYDPSWATFFRQERTALLEAAGASIVGLEHVGSSAVPQLVSRPAIDILIGTRSRVAARRLDCVLEELGYHCLDQGVAQIRRFARIDEQNNIVYCIHLVTFGGPEWRRYLAVRDHLRRHPDEVRRYVILKNVTAQWGRSLYRKAKALFFSSILDGGEGP